PWKPTSMPSFATITYRHAPPTRRSISHAVSSPRFACHQRRTSSGVVHALNTSSFGASNSRVTRICSSVGSVTVALRVTVISFVLLFEFFQHCIELLEALAPRALVVLHPVVDRPQRLAVQPVQPLPPRLPHLDGSDLPEHAEVLRHLRLGETQGEHEVVHGPLAACEDVEDLPPARLGDRVERVGGRCCPCHGRIIYSYIGICQPMRES